MRTYPVVLFVIVAGLIPFACSTFMGRGFWPHPPPPPPQQKPPKRQPPICIMDLKDCDSNVAICGRMGFSNQCQKFQNNCHMEVANCNQAAYSLAPYAAADAKFCEDIPLNSRGLCKGLPSNEVYSGGYPNREHNHPRVPRSLRGNMAFCNNFWPPSTLG